MKKVCGIAKLISVILLIHKRKELLTGTGLYYITLFVPLTLGLYKRRKLSLFVLCVIGGTIFMIVVTIYC